MIELILTIIAVYSIYYIFMIRKYDAYGNLKPKKERMKKLFKSKKKQEKEDILLRGKKSKKIKDNSEPKIPAEIEILIVKYKLDMKKLNYRGLLKLVGLVCSIDIAIVVTIVSYIDVNMYLKLIIGAVLSIPTILISYAILGRYFKKKGLTKDV